MQQPTNFTERRRGKVGRQRRGGARPGGQCRAAVRGEKCQWSGEGRSCKRRAGGGRSGNTRRRHCRGVEVSREWRQVGKEEGSGKS